MKISVLDTDIKYLPGIGPKRAQLLSNEIGVHTFRDMLYYFPFRWIDKSKVYPISSILSDSLLEGEDTPSSSYIQIRGVIVKKELVGFSGNRPVKGKSRLVATMQDATGKMELVFFSGLKWIMEKLVQGEEFIAFGKPSVFNSHVNLVHPEVYKPSEAVVYGTGSMAGIYSITEKMKKDKLFVRADPEIHS